MFCNKCGKQIQDNIKFCNYCGAPVVALQPKEEKKVVPIQPMPVQAPVQTAPAVKAKRKKMDKRYLIALCALLVIATLCSVSYYYFQNRKTIINMNNYISIQASGIDEYGKVNWEIDEEKFLKDYGKQIKIDRTKAKESRAHRSALDEIEALDTPVAAILPYVEGSFSKDKNLANGDEITLHLTAADGMEEMQDLLKCKVALNDISWKVEGLSQLQPFDPFEYFTYKLYGVEGDGRLEVFPVEDELVKDQLIFVADKTTGLSDGDQVLVTAELKDQAKFEETHGKRMVNNQKTFQIEGLAVADVTSFSQIGNTKMEELKTYVKDFYYQYAEDDWIFEYDIQDFKYCGYYFKTLKEPNSNRNANELYLVFKPKLAFWELEVDGFEYYYVMKYENLKLDAKGNCVVHKEDGTFGPAELTLKSKINPYTYVRGYETIKDLENYIGVNDNAYNVESEMNK